MKKINAFWLIMLAFLLYQCDRGDCDAFSGRVLSGRMETFFGSYKPGNWWFYQNQDSTKKDSVYLLSFTDSLLKNQDNCTVFGRRKFTLHNTHVASGNDIAVAYDAVESGISFKMEAQNAGLPSFTSATDSLIVSLPATDNIGSNSADSIRLNGVIYYNILTGKKNPNTYYFGKDKGLVGWGTPTDTFNLARSRIL